MNTKENNMNIIELARQAGFERLGHTDNDWVCGPEDIEAFADLIEAAARADEREECADVCIKMANRCDDIRKAALEVAAENIRARGTT